MGLGSYLHPWILLFLAASGSVSCSRNVSGTVSKSVTLPATMTVPAQSTIQWKFYNEQIVIALPDLPPAYYGMYRGRCTLHGNAALQLDNLTDTDTGEYSLTVTPQSGTAQTEVVYLTVYSPLTPPALKVNISTTNGNAYPVNDTSVTLHCDAGGQNVVNYTFYRDGVAVCSQPHVTCIKEFLYFQPITMGDTGRYTCKIENPISSNTSQPLSIIVIARVSGVTLSSNASSGLISVGKDSVNLTCSALGTNVTFSWHLDEKPLPSNPRYHLMNSNSSLIISPVERTDNGSFTCTGSNSLNNETSSPLTIGWSPDEAIQCNATDDTQTVNLLCSWSGGNPPAIVTMIFQNQSETLNNTVSKSVPKANVNTSETLSCKGAQNRQDVSCVLLIDVPQGKQNNVDSSVKEGNQATMSVNLIFDSARTISSQVLPAKFKWIDPHNKIITNGDNYTITFNDSFSQLVISRVTLSDNGTYKCEATNFMGSCTFIFQLTIEQASEQGSDNSLSVGAIVGIVIGSLAGVALIATAAFFIVKSTKKKSNKDRSSNSQMPMSGLTDKNQENEEYVKYADLRFKNANPTNKAASEQVPETEYSTVKR